MNKKERVELDNADGWQAFAEDYLLRLHKIPSSRRDAPDNSAQADEPTGEEETLESKNAVTLGLVCYKLGLYPRAYSIFSQLVSSEPTESVHLLNQALVCFRLGKTQSARTALQRCVELEPSYRKALGYLGLAHQRLGDYEAAERAFAAAGVNHLASRMKLLTLPAAAPAEEQPALPQTSLEEKMEGGGTHTPFGDLGFSVPSPVPIGSGTAAFNEPMPISDILQGNRLPEPLVSRYLISETGYLLEDIIGQGYSRLDGLHFCTSSGLSYKPVKRRLRGQQSEALFGDADSVVFEIEGNGRLGFHPREGVFAALSLDGETIYIRERFIFAFGPELGFENGRMPATNDALVHILGRGNLVLKTPLAIKTLEVTPDRGVIIPAGGLVGWLGHLLPRPAQGNPFDRSLNAIELSGEGVLLFNLS